MSSQKKKKYILIFGSSGLIGKEFFKSIDKKKFKVITFGRSSADYKIDLSKDIDTSVLHKFGEGDIAIYLSAVSSPQRCLDEYDLSSMINVQSSSILIEFLIQRGVSVFFASSDVVYGETIHPVNELSELNPDHGYPKMKYDIERKFSKFNNFKIFRLSYVWSFENSFSKFLLSAYKKGDEIEIFDPFVRSIVDISDVILFLTICCENPDAINKITNVCGPESISRLDLIKSISKHINIKYNVSDDDENFFLYRPKNIFMKSLYLEGSLGKKANNIHDSLNKIEGYI